MTWANQDKTAIVGIGATDYYVRGKSCRDPSQKGCGLGG